MYTFSIVTWQFAIRCMEQCKEVQTRHSEIQSSKFNDDTIYRALVTEMLALKAHALIKMESLIFLSKQDEQFWIGKSIHRLPCMHTYKTLNLMTSFCLKTNL